MTGREEHRIPATRFHDSLRGRRARRICREIWNLVVGARARGSFEDVVVRRAPGFTTASSIERERERRERIRIEKKASARKRETNSRLSRKGSISLRIAGKCSKRVLVPGRDTEWQYRAFSSLLSKRSLARGRERGCSTTEIATRCRMTGHGIPKARYSWLLFLFSRIQFKQIVPSRLLIPTENSSELHPRSRHLKSLSRFPVPPSLRNHEPQPKYLLLYTRILCTRAYLHNLYAA